MDMISQHRAQGCAAPAFRTQYALSASLGYDNNVNQGASSRFFGTGSDGRPAELDKDFLPKADRYTQLNGEISRPIGHRSTVGFGQVRLRRHASVRDQDTSMGRETLYLRMLGRFLAGQGRFRADFDEARLSGDDAAPCRVAHTLRGTAGNIGAMALAAAATELELACKGDTGEDDIARLLAAVDNELRPVLAGLAALDAGVPAGPP
eukprot:gene31369-35412_t